MYVNNLDMFGNLRHITFCWAYYFSLNLETFKKSGVLKFEAKFNTYFYSSLCCSLILQR